MSEERTLREAIEAWMVQLRTQESEELLLTPAELYDFLLQPEQHPRRNEIRQALGMYPKLAAMLSELAASQREAMARLSAWDVALPKAAAVAGEGTKKITTEGGKYTIEIRPHLGKVNRSLVVVRVAAACRDQLEGKLLELQDSGGQVLVQRRVVDGEISGELGNLNQIDGGFVIRTALLDS